MLTNNSIKKIESELKKYPDNQRQSAVIASLQIVQAENGWLTNANISDVADFLNMSEIAAMEVATFYNMFDLKSVGKYKISVCTNISCMLRNSDEIVIHLKEKLGINFNEITSDGKFCLKESECMGACDGAPLFLINNQKLHNHLTPEKVDQILKELK
jgi:NADH-quinone oxidoreductase subunit E